MIVKISIEVSLSSGRFLSNMNLDLSTAALSRKMPLWLPCRGRSARRKELSVWEAACRDYQPQGSPSLRLWANLKRTLNPPSHASGRGACLRVPVLGPCPLCLGAAQSLRIVQRPCSSTIFGGSQTCSRPYSSIPFAPLFTDTCRLLACDSHRHNFFHCAWQQHFSLSWSPCSWTKLRSTHLHTVKPIYWQWVVFKESAVFIAGTKQGVWGRPKLPASFQGKVF